jgi:hypothetical protein
VGDGINDAPGLVQGNVEIAIGTGIDVAIESAGVVLVKNDPRDVVRLICLNSATMSENLAWATGYDLVVIPAAARVLQSWGVPLRPEWGCADYGWKHRHRGLQRPTAPGIKSGDQSGQTCSFVEARKLITALWRFET